MTFNEIIRAYLKQAKITVKQLAKKINVNENIVQSWVDGEEYIPYKQMNFVLRKLEFTGVCDHGKFHYEGHPQTLKKKFQTEKGRQRYYESATFDNLKEKVAKRSHNKCELCGCPGSGQDGRKGLTCHHLVYDTDFGTGKEDLNDLIDVCYYHHSMLHAVDNPEKAKAFMEFKDGAYKVLLIPHKDGSYNIKLFHDECNDADIKAYFKQLMRKVKFKPSFEILKLGKVGGNKLNTKDFSHIADARSNSNAVRLNNRAEGHCELCGGKLETIFNLQTKNNKFDEKTPTYSLLGLCKECAKTLASGKTVQTNQEVRIIVFKENGKHTIQGVPGSVSEKEITSKIKGNYTIEGPFYITDIISKSKLQWYLHKKERRIYEI